MAALEKALAARETPVTQAKLTLSEDAGKDDGEPGEAKR